MRELHQLTLPKDATVLVLVDFQERLYRAMDPERKDEVVKNTGFLINLARLLKMPIMVTEQYPAGLGKTIPPVQEVLPSDARVFEKLIFSAWREERFAAHFNDLAARAAIVTGMEAHVCVLGTVLDMVKQGITVHVPRDAVISRSKENWQTGLDVMGQAGALITSTETVIFQLLDRAGTEEFKAMSKLLK